MKKIIIVDDEIYSLHAFLDEILNSDGIEYKFFKDERKKIIQYIKNNDISAAFLDINMPNINGFELAKEINKISPKTQFIFVTGLNLNMQDVPNEIKNKVLGIMYKPVKIDELEQYLNKIENKNVKMVVHTFGTFDCFINNRVVNFSSSKSKELFALLVTFNGKTLSMEHAITCLWPDKFIEKAKISYRDAVWRLRQTLNEVGFNYVSFSRACITLDPSNIECDYYDVLNGRRRFSADDDFLISYEWSLPYENKLRELDNEKKY